MNTKLIAWFMSVMTTVSLWGGATVHADPKPEARTSWPTQEFVTGEMPFPGGIWLGAVKTFFLNKGLRHTNLVSTSLLIMHHGELVYEEYNKGWDKDKPHHMFSVTKSVLSALVGIAIAEGKINSVQDKVIDYYPDAVLAPGQESKKDMTIEHLLTMTSGLPGDAEGGHVEWWKAPDSGKAAFETPQARKPGETFVYNSGPAMQTLGCLVSRAVKQNLFEYAKEKLFAPLGMTSAKWDAAKDGNTYGGFGLSLTSRDMLRFGYLYLNGGMWDGKQILPKKWVQDSAPSAGENYGYLFWNSFNYPGYEKCYEANGSFGKFICIMPELDTVLVRTSRPELLTRTANQLAYKSKAFNSLLDLVLEQVSLQGIPMDYIRETMK